MAESFGKAGKSPVRAHSQAAFHSKGSMIQALDLDNCGIARLGGREAPHCGVKADEPTNRLGGARPTQRRRDRGETQSKAKVGLRPVSALSRSLRRPMGSQPAEVYKATRSHRAYWLADLLIR